MIRFVKKSDPKPAAEDAGGESVKKVPRQLPTGIRKPPTTARLAARRRRRKMTTRLSEHSAAPQFTT